VVSRCKTIVQKLHNYYNTLMLTDVTAIRTYFAKLGLEEEIADLYLALHTHGPQTISELSRNARVERTRIYRLIDKLMSSNLIEVETQSRRGIIKAAPIANLHILITEKEQELHALKDELDLIQQVLARNSLSSPAARVQFYSGPEGIRQMLWNELDAADTVLGYHFQPLDTAVGAAFMARWAAELKKRGITYRLLPPEALALTHSCDVYSDTVAYFNWQDGEVFGFEIHNKQIANAQRHLLRELLA
jgi:DNA-binding MarR family transcriptional regulator